VLRLVVAASAVVALGTAAWRLPTSVHTLNNRHAAAAELPASERELPAARLYGIDFAALDRLRRLLPRDAVYLLVRPGAGAPLDALAFAGLAQDYLLPRRATDGRSARWVVAYRRDPRAGGLRLARVFELGGGVRVGEVAR
jgi:hypothetical protein